MQIRSSTEALTPPDRLDRRFAVVAGLYVAALLSPALLFPVVARLGIDSYRLVLAALGVTGTVIAALGAWQITRWSSVLVWLNSSWATLPLAGAGLLSMVAYWFEAFVFVGVSVADLQPDSAKPFVGFAGFVLGIVAGCLGALLVQMGRNRLVETTVEERAFEAEWTASWPRRARLTVMVGTLGAVAVGVGAIVWWPGISVISGTVFVYQPLVLVLIVGMIFGVGQLVSERTYRVTPDGLEIRREALLLDSRRLVPWSQLDGFTVTDDAVVFHQVSSVSMSIRCSRWDLSLEETDVIRAVNTHLTRRAA